MQHLQLNKETVIFQSNNYVNEDIFRYKTQKKL